MKKDKVDKFLDVDFGPKDANDELGNSTSLYRNGELPQKGYAEPKDVEWVYSE